MWIVFFFLNWAVALAAEKPFHFFALPPKPTQRGSQKTVVYAASCKAKRRVCLSGLWRDTSLPHLCGTARATVHDKRITRQQPLLLLLRFHKLPPSPFSSAASVPSQPTRQRIPVLGKHAASAGLIHCHTLGVFVVVVFCFLSFPFRVSLRDLSDLWEKSHLNLVLQNPEIDLRDPQFLLTCRHFFHWTPVCLFVCFLHHVWHSRSCSAGDQKCCWGSIRPAGPAISTGFLSASLAGAESSMSHTRNVRGSGKSMKEDVRPQ